MAQPRETFQPPAPDIGALLETLRSEVRARRLAEGRAEPTPAERDLQRSLDEIELYRVVSAHWPLIGTTPLQKAVNFVNKLVRYGLRWYINPIVEQQNAYNDAVARALHALTDAYAELAAQQQDPPPAERRPPPDGDLAARSHAELVALQRERAAEEPPAAFPDLDLMALAPQLALRQQVNAHWPLAGATPRERLTAQAQKLIRRYLRWLINPIVEQQNAANAAFTVALLALARLDAERRAALAASRARRVD